MGKKCILTIVCLTLLGCGTSTFNVTRIRASDGKMADLLECESKVQCLKVASKCPRGYSVLDDGITGTRVKSESDGTNVSVKASKDLFMVIRCK